MILLFVFKQKTAYEMRISDWSSDVCSSDLGAVGTRRNNTDRRAGRSRIWPRSRQLAPRIPPTSSSKLKEKGRSEEHTSELQSLMRISYAVFCLKKKNKKQIEQ